MLRSIQPPQLLDLPIPGKLGMQFYPPLPNPGLYLPGYPGRGAVLEDFSGNGNHGSILGVTWGRLTSGQRVLTYGGAGYVEVPYSATLNPATMYICVWAKPAAAGAGTDRCLLCSREATPTRGYIIYARADNTWESWHGNGTGWDVLTMGAVVADTWVFICAVHDGIVMTSYLNTTKVSAAKSTLVANTQFPVRIGAGSTEGDPTLYFKGQTGLLAVYSGSLNDAQESNVFQHTRRLYGI